MTNTIRILRPPVSDRASSLKCGRSNLDAPFPSRPASRPETAPTAARGANFAIRPPLTVRTFTMSVVPAARTARRGRTAAAAAASGGVSSSLAATTAATTAATGAVTWRKRVGAGLPPDPPPSGGRRRRAAWQSRWWTLFLLRAAPPIPAKLLCAA